MSFGKGLGVYFSLFTEIVFQSRPFSGQFAFDSAAYKNKVSFYREFVLIFSMHINTVLMEKHVRNLVCPLCYLPDIESENIEFDFYFSMIEREVSENPSILLFSFSNDTNQWTFDEFVHVLVDTLDGIQPELGQQLPQKRNKTILLYDFQQTCGRSTETKIKA